MGVLMLLMTICGLIAAVVLLVYAFWTNKDWLKSFVLGGVMIWLAGYAILLFAVSFFSEEKTLAFNEPKEFCGFYFDCHLHTAVTDVRKTKTLDGITANGEFYIVKVRVSSNANQATLHLVAPDFAVVDANGNRYKPDSNFENSNPNWDQKVPAGGRFEKEIVFDLPADVKNPRLDVRGGYGIDHAIEAVLIGDEDSIGHKRNYLQIEPDMQTASK